MGSHIDENVQALVDYLSKDRIVDVGFGDTLADTYDKFKETFKDVDLPIKIHAGSPEEAALEAAFQQAADRGKLPPEITRDNLSRFLAQFNRCSLADVGMYRREFVSAHGLPPISSGKFLMREACCLAVIELVEPT